MTDNEIIKALVGLINRQKAENKELKIELKAMQGAANTYRKWYHEAKSETIKEFTERLKSRLRFCYQNQGMLEKEFCLIHIDETVKEMTEV